MKNFSDPWPHIVIDDFINEQFFEEIKNEVIEFVKSKNIKKSITVFDNLNLDEYPELKKTVSYLNSELFPINEDFLKNHFPKHRSYSNPIGTRHQIIVCVGKYSEYRVHCDAEEKLLSVVTYIHPSKSLGTLIYDRNKNLVKTVDWKPNRTLIFAPITDLTWHTYKAKDGGFRVTLNTFLRRKL